MPWLITGARASDDGRTETEGREEGRMEVREGENIRIRKVRAAMNI